MLEVISRCLVIEVKAIERLNPIHAAQLLTYLRLTGHRIGLLMNFHAILLKDGLRRLML
jgi:GxxExxY protein